MCLNELVTTIFECSQYMDNKHYRAVLEQAGLTLIDNVGLQQANTLCMDYIRGCDGFPYDDMVSINQIIGAELLTV